MVQQQMVMYEEEFKQIAALCERLTREANAKAVLLVDQQRAVHHQPRRG